MNSDIIQYGNIVKVTLQEDLFLSLREEADLSSQLWVLEDIKILVWRQVSKVDMKVDFFIHEHAQQLI